MLVELYNKEKHYEKIAKWWLEHGQDPVAPDLLPNIGVVANDLVAAFLYQTDSKLCYIDSMISKKDSNKEDRRSAIDSVIINLTDMAKEMGYKVIIANVISKRLSRDHDKWNFTKYYDNVETFCRRL